MAESQDKDRMHLINDIALKDKKLNPEELTAFMAINNMRTMGKQYNVVSIIGSQSTGKSTLLNKIFSTQFAVQQRSQQLGQTTVGIWLSKDTKSNTLVLDVEGSDSVERKTSEAMVENQTALFALAMSHAFLINVFMNSLGQHTSCQLSIIRIIMQMNLKLFQQDTVKHIIFVIRDWEEEAHYEDAVKRVNKYLNDIWDDISKPDSMQNVSFDKLFKVQVETLCYYKMKEFQQQTDSLRHKIVDPKDKDFIFKNFEYERNLPADALPSFLSNIWDTIANNKDLNLPNEKILVSNLRCQQIKADSIDNIKNHFAEIATQLSKGYYPEFGKVGRTALSEATKMYLKDSIDYTKDVVLEKQQELESEIMNKLYVFFQKQVDQLKKFLMEDFGGLLEQLKVGIPIINLPSSLKEIQQSSSQTFKTLINDSLIIEKVWQEDDYTSQFESQVKQQIDHFVENQINIYYQKLDKQIKIQCEALLDEQIVIIDVNFWENLQVNFDALLQKNYTKLEEILNAFEISQLEVDNYLSKFEKECKQNLEMVIKTQSQRFKEVLFQKFKRSFNRSLEGQPRDWKKITEEEILHLFNETKDQIWVLLDTLKTNQIKSKSIAQLSANKVIKSVFLPKGIKVQQAEDFLDFDRIVLTEANTQNIRSLLLEEFDTLFQEALQKHVYNYFKKILKKQDFLQNIPKWFWFLLLFFMYDDVFRWLGNPLFLYPILMIICFVGFCIAIGYHGLPKALFQQLIAQFNQLLGPIIFGGLSKLKSH